MVLRQFNLSWSICVLQFIFLSKVSPKNLTWSWYASGFLSSIKTCRNLSLQKYRQEVLIFEIFQGLTNLLSGWKGDLWQLNSKDNSLGCLSGEKGVCGGEISGKKLWALVENWRRGRFVLEYAYVITKTFRLWKQ